MNISEGLKKLIDAALADGKITKEEKNVLLKKAEGEGIDAAEFELYLNGLLHSSNAMSSKNKLEKVQSFLKWLVAKKRRMVVAGFLCLFVLGMIGSLFEEFKKADKISDLGCENVEDCLMKYKFEEARLFHSEMSGFEIDKDAALRSIISAEISYYLSNDVKDMALRSIQEFSFDESIKNKGEIDDNEMYNELATWYNSNLKKLIVEFEDDSKTVKSLVYSIKPIAVAGKLISKSDTGEAWDIYSFTSDDKEQKSLMKKYGIK